MAGDLHCPPGMVADAEIAALAESDIAALDIFRGRRRNAAPGRLFDRKVAARVVPMVVRVPHLGDAPSAPSSLGERRRWVARVNHGGFAARFVMDEPDVIVGERRDGDDLHGPIL
jgi:hypothetical protein